MIKKDNILEKMSLIDTKYVESANYSEVKKKFRVSKLAAIAACVAACIIISGTAYASGALDAVMAYFMGENEDMQTLLLDGDQVSSNDTSSIRLDNYIADERTCHFTISYKGFDNPINTGEEHNIVWICADGKEYTEFNREVGAYTEGFSIGSGIWANAKSAYDDADATLIFNCEVPNGMKASDFKEIKVEYSGLSLDINLKDAVVNMYSPKSIQESKNIRNLVVSSVGLYFDVISEIESIEIALIDNDGNYIRADEKSDFAYSLSMSREDDVEWATVTGSWSGDSPISVKILDIDNYKGIQINGEDFLFEK